MEYDVNKIEFVKTQKTNTSYKRANIISNLYRLIGHNHIFLKNNFFIMF